MANDCSWCVRSAERKIPAVRLIDGAIYFEVINGIRRVNQSCDSEFLLQSTFSVYYFQSICSLLLGYFRAQTKEAKFANFASKAASDEKSPGDDREAWTRSDKTTCREVAFGSAFSGRFWTLLIYRWMGPRRARTALRSARCLSREIAAYGDLPPPLGDTLSLSSPISSLGSSRLPRRVASNLHRAAGEIEFSEIQFRQIAFVCLIIS